MIKTNTRSYLVALTVILSVITAVSNLFLCYLFFNTSPQDKSEFASLQSLAQGLYAILIILMSIITIVTSPFVLKLKRWAYILNIIIFILIVPLLAISHLKEITYLLAPGFSVSFNKEVVPLVTLLLFFLSLLKIRNMK